MPNQAEILIEGQRVLQIAPAGYGKTYLIAKAITYCTDGKQLILTHTHAGVRSIQAKLNHLQVSTKKYEVNTIAGWALKLASTFPFLSQLKDFSPTSNNNWQDVYSALSILIKNNSIKRIIQATYKGLFVDEYQDCTIRQHLLILALADILPCRILGDPFQGIFDFDKNESIVDWDKDIYPEFIKLDDLTIPWRWQLVNNSRLGETLKTLRGALENGTPFDLRTPPIRWIKNEDNNQLKQCYSFANKKLETTVAIHQLPYQCNIIARNLRGTYGILEPLECGDLFTSISRIEKTKNFKRVLNIIDFAAKCMTNINASLKTACLHWNRGEIARIISTTKYSGLITVLNKIAQSDELSIISEALPLFRTIEDSFLFRKELWYEMSRTFTLYKKASGNSSLHDIAWNIRNQHKNQVRRIDDRIISRTLLVKGLEFDNVIVLDANNLDKKNLYVAMTRGTKNLVVLSDDPIINL